MLWRIIIKEFGGNIPHIAGVDSIVADTISIFPSTSVDKYKPRTMKAECFENCLFAIGRYENNEYFPC